MRAEALGRPGFAEAEQTALDGTGGGMLFDDAIRLYSGTAREVGWTGIWE